MMRNSNTLQLTSIIVVGLMCVVMPSRQPLMAQPVSPASSPDQLAAAIANTMNATRPAIPANSPIVQSFSSHGSVVESRTLFRDANAFANATTNRRNLQAASTRYMCNPSRLAYFKKGVSINNVFVGPDNQQSFSFVIDETACASLAKTETNSTAAASPKLAQDVAEQIASDLSKTPLVAGSHFEKVTVEGRTIRVTNAVVAAAFASYFKARDFEIRGKTQGWFCTKFGDAIRQGVRIQVIYHFENGPPILDFAVDHSIC